MTFAGGASQHMANDQIDTAGIAQTGDQYVEEGDREQTTVGKAAQRLLGVDDAKAQQHHKRPHQHHIGAEAGQRHQREDGTGNGEGDPGIQRHEVALLKRISLLCLPHLILNSYNVLFFYLFQAYKAFTLCHSAFTRDSPRLRVSSAAPARGVE